MNRKERRALAHKERKLSRQVGFPESTIVFTTREEEEPSPESAAAPSFETSECAASTTSIITTTPAISPARLAANRANSQLSTGPSEQGKLISCQNHTSHGLARHNGAFKLLTSEDPAAFDALKASLLAEHQPETETEFILVTRMAESQWLTDRAVTLQHTCLDPDTGAVSDTKLMSLYMRYHSTHLRAFNQSLANLLKLRKEKNAAELGFEAQRIASEQHEMKKDHHYWDIIEKNSKVSSQLGSKPPTHARDVAQDPHSVEQIAA